MLKYLKSHPFAVEAFFDSSVVLTFAVPKNELKHLIPECLELDTFEGKWAFIAVAMVQTKGLRPKGFPKIFGSDFFLIGYRIFVRYTINAGKSLRGLYILKSETDKRKMELMGNIFTHYNYSTIDIETSIQDQKVEIQSIQAGLKVNIEVSAEEEEVSLPQDSPFPDWKAARRFAGPLPFTFTYLSDSNEVLIIEGRRQNWKPKAIKVVDYQFPFMNDLILHSPVLANAFIIKDIPYYWERGRIESWK